MLPNNFWVPLNKVEVRRSTIRDADNGVFAKTNIAKNELITFYPADLIEWCPNGDRKVKDHFSFWWGS